MAFFGSHFVTDLTWAKLGKSEATFDAPNWPFQNTGYMYSMCLKFSMYDVKDV